MNLEKLFLLIKLHIVSLLKLHISLYFENKKKYQILTETVLMNLQIKNYHKQAFLYLVNLAEYKLILRDN